MSSCFQEGEDTTSYLKNHAHKNVSFSPYSVQSVAEQSVAVEGLVVAMPVVIDTFYMDCKTMQLCFTKFEWLIRL